MKATKLILIATAALTLAACDTKDTYIIYSGTTAEWTDGQPVAQHQQRAYVEKYTGPKCINCPLADVTLDEAHHQFGDRLVVVAINHPTGQGEPYNGQPDMRTDEGTAWDNYFGINGIPAAYINRNTQTQYQGAMSDIVGEISSVISRQPIVAIEGECSVAHTNPATADVTVNIEFVEAYTRPLTLTLAVIEDSLAYWQLTLEGKQDNYMHNHMLRMVATDLWGTDIDCTGAQGECRKATFSFTLPEDLGTYFHVVAFVSDKASREVLNSVQL